MRVPPRLMPALITPFTPSGAIDETAHSHNVRLLWERGVAGFLVAGSTGEGPYLEGGERSAVAGTARDAAPEAFVLCGVSAESVRTALAQVSEAAEGGADAVLVVTPTSLVRGRDERVSAFYREVADASPLPVFLYSVPKVTGYELPVEAAAGLAHHASVVGMKDSGGQPVRVPAILGAAPEGFPIYSGSTPALALAIAGGARGGITASANYAAGLADTVIDAPDPAAALSSQAALTRVAAAVEAHGIGGVKTAASLTGLQPGTVRSPLAMPPEPVAAQIEQALSEAGII